MAAAKPSHEELMRKAKVFILGLLPFFHELVHFFVGVQR